MQPTSRPRSRANPALLLTVLLALWPLLAATPATPVSAAPSTPPASSQAAPLAQTPIAKLIVFAPGIDTTLTTNAYDPYGRATESFGQAPAPFATIMGLLGCTPVTQRPAAGSPLIPCTVPGGTNNAWVPYSYTGAAGAPCSPSGILNYTGLATGQDIATSAANLQSVIAYARGCPGAANAQVYVVAHSLGGAIASYWNSDHPEATIITLDSPVKGIWNENDLAIYCQSSVGLPGVVSPQICAFAAGLRPLTVAAPIVAQLNQPAVIAKENQANAINIANPADLFVPSWFAIDPGAKLGNILLPATPCTEPGAPIQLNHACVLVAAAQIVADAVQTGACLGCGLRPRQTINLLVCNVPAGATLNLSHAGQPINAAAVPSTACPGGLTATVPWIDIVVRVVSAAGVTLFTQGALPAGNTDLTLTYQAATPTPVVPEPSPLLLFGAGLLGLGVLQRRRRRARR